MNPDSGKCFDVAIDHGFFNELAFLKGIEDIRNAVEVIVKANPDAIQLTPGQLKYLQRVPGKAKPALVLRTDVANVYGKELPAAAFSKMIETPVLQAVRADAACMCVNLFRIPGAPEVTAQCIDNIIKIKMEAEHYGMPLMIEPLVFRANSEAGGYMVDGDLDKILPLVRQAVELGADIIKADPCDRLEEYHKVIETAGEVPVLVRGGGRAGDEEILRRTQTLLEQGIAGIVYGRNIIQHAFPDRITRALMGMVHTGYSVDTCLAILKEGKTDQDGSAW
ncbi:Fructose-bisphosphate aldolase class Ia, DhnA family [Niabella drilacis]|uniref:Fructose-bisphosphate aldolase class Ia, DhnA family n=2 Tax=Niabella drilacis (strain DSM 25811 / CCM 8410 / CCUG 62505 / LMG 26954 / E90) TaxID=1285928 RepID=A0A1G6LU44_NIADE|nr:Fructose-bisphosphate aldolase class Ia, DhnA family [Niabella drilacis]